MIGTVLGDGVGPERSAADAEAGDRARAWGERRMVGSWSGQSGLLRRAVWLVVEAGCHGRQRCGAAGPGPGGAQDEGQEQQLEYDAEAVVEEPGRTHHVERHVGDLDRGHDEV